MASTLDIIIQAQDKASAVFEKVGASSDGLGNKLKALGAVALASAAAFASWKTLETAIAKTTELGEATRKLSGQTGMSAHDASAFLFVLAHVGKTADDATRSMGILSKNMENAAFAAQHGKAEVNPFTESMTALGVKFLDTSNHMRGTNEVFLELADRFAGLQSGGQKVALAMDIFGKSGKDMLPILSLGREGIMNLEKEADHLHLTLTGKNVNSIHEYVLAQRTMNESLGTMQLQIGTAVMPVLTALANVMINLQPIIFHLVDEGIDKLSELLPVWEAIKIQAETQIGGVIGIVKNVVDIFEKAADLVSDVAHGDWAGAWADLKDIAEDVAKVMINNIAMLFGQLPNLMIAAVNEMIKAWNSVQSKFTGKLNFPGVGNVNPLAGQDLSVGELGKINFEVFNLNDALAKIAPLARSAHDAIDTSGLNQALIDIPPVADEAKKAHKDLTDAADKTAPALKSAADAMTSVADAAVVAWHQMTDAESQSAAKANATNSANTRPTSSGGSVAYFMAGYGHAGGLPYVPYDGYPAILHKGEAVVTAAQNANGGGNVIINVNVSGSINGVDDVKRIIRETLSGGGLRGYSFG